MTQHKIAWGTKYERPMRERLDLGGQQILWLVATAVLSNTSVPLFLLIVIGNNLETFQAAFQSQCPVKRCSKHLWKFHLCLDWSKGNWTFFYCVMKKKTIKLPTITKGLNIVCFVSWNPPPKSVRLSIPFFVGLLCFSRSTVLFFFAFSAFRGTLQLLWRQH